MMALFEFAQFRLLLGGEERGDSAMSFLKNLADLSHCLLAFCLQLGSGMINNGRNLFHLLRRKFQFRPQMSLHVLCHGSVMRTTKHPPSAAGRAEEPAGNAGEKDEDEGEDQFPPQRAIHWLRLLSIALSAMAYSLSKSLVELET